MIEQRIDGHTACACLEVGTSLHEEHLLLAPVSAQAPPGCEPPASPPKQHCATVGRGCCDDFCVRSIYVELLEAVSERPLPTAQVWLGHLAASLAD